MASPSLRNTTPGAGRDFRVDWIPLGRGAAPIVLWIVLSNVRPLLNAYPSLSKRLAYSYGPPFCHGQRSGMRSDGKATPPSLAIIPVVDFIHVIKTGKKKLKHSTITDLARVDFQLLSEQGRFQDNEQSLLAGFHLSKSEAQMIHTAVTILYILFFVPFAILIVWGGYRIWKGLRG
jgi:hypothetical protein